jgi:hypothetical protein
MTDAQLHMIPNDPITVGSHFWSDDVCADSVAASCHTGAPSTLDSASHDHGPAVLSGSDDQASDLKLEYA